jgi:hypothetical protein
MQLALHIASVSVSFPLPIHAPLPCRPSAGAFSVTHRGRSKLLTLAPGTLGRRLIRCCRTRSVVPLPGVCLAFMQPPVLFSLSAPLLVPTRIASTLTSGPRPSATRELPLLDKRLVPVPAPARRTSLPARFFPPSADPPIYRLFIRSFHPLPPKPSFLGSFSLVTHSIGFRRLGACLLGVLPGIATASRLSSGPLDFEPCVTRRPARPRQELDNPL